MPALSDLAHAVSLGLSLLSSRVLVVLALLMAFALFCVAMYQGSWVHLSIAGGFGVIVFWPVLMRDRPKEAPRGEE